MNFALMFKRNFVTTQGVNVLKYGSQHFNRVLKNRFFFCVESSPSILMLEAAKSIRDEIVSFFPRPNISRNMIVMNFRSGAFRKAEKLCDQPCCQFNLDAMKRDIGHDKVLLVSEDSSLRNFGIRAFEFAWRYLSSS
jgi:hypothetical protein